VRTWQRFLQELLAALLALGVLVAAGCMPPKEQPQQ